MHISIFESLGPIMIGPSSSHTAGAARLACVARKIVAKEFTAVTFGLHGSFWHTHKGHGTDRALVAGALGLAPDDERLVDSFSLAQKQGLSYSFRPVTLDGVHENTVEIIFTCTDGTTPTIIGSSLGGGEIVVRSIDGFPTDLSARLSTLVVQHEDRPGVLTNLTQLLSDWNINVGTMKVSRTAKGKTAFSVIETDSDIPEQAVEIVRGYPHIQSAQVINLSEEGGTCTKT
ncbi:MAG: L-serine ammonia-lyase, iron-sulfur-dependent subunit beta [Eubacteriales bacterium]